MNPKNENQKFELGLEKRFCDYYVDKLCELTAKTQNDFYTEVAQEIVRLRQQIEVLEEYRAKRDQLSYGDKP